MPGFPDKFMPFMDETGSRLATTSIKVYSTSILPLRKLTIEMLDDELKWPIIGRNSRLDIDLGALDPARQDVHSINGDQNANDGHDDGPEYPSGYR